MINVVGVRFSRAGKIYYFNPVKQDVKVGDHVIVENSRGVDFGTVVLGMKEIDEKTLPSPCKNIMRVAGEDDVKRHEDNLVQQKEAMKMCQQKILQHKLPMKLINASYTFDRSKIVFYFSAEGRVDFRDLVKDLAGIFRTRIELRQIGVRDEAKIIGGYSSCGRELCCYSVLGDFHPVSIKMAKQQNLSLNPAKISGICGRLMCCLNYEYEEEPRKPKNRKPKTEAGENAGCGGCGGAAAASTEEKQGCCGSKNEGGGCCGAASEERFDAGMLEDMANEFDAVNGKTAGGEKAANQERPARSPRPQNRNNQNRNRQNQENGNNQNGNGQNRNNQNQNQNNQNKNGQNGNNPNRNNQNKNNQPKDAVAKVDGENKPRPRRKPRPKQDKKPFDSGANNNTGNNVEQKTPAKPVEKPAVKPTEKPTAKTTTEA